MENIGKAIAVIIYGVATISYCLGYIQEAIYFVLSAIHINLGILIDKNNGKDR